MKEPSCECNGPAAERPGIYTSLMPLVLASASPRRLELLGNLGCAFRVLPSRAQEPPAAPGQDPADYAETLAEAKTREVAERLAAEGEPGAAIIGADTVVALERTGEHAGVILGKPTDRRDAVRMLELLSGRTHVVVTGCCLLLPGGGCVRFHGRTNVRMRRSTREELTAYAATGEPDDKAGAYAIQGIGSFLVEHVEGSYTNVVGLPLAEVVEVLVSWGVIVPRKD
jgi:septum formation protein